MPPPCGPLSRAAAWLRPGAQPLSLAGVPLTPCPPAPPALAPPQTSSSSCGRWESPTRGGVGTRNRFSSSAIAAPPRGASPQGVPSSARPPGPVSPHTQTTEAADTCSVWSGRCLPRRAGGGIVFQVTAGGSDGCPCAAERGLSPCFPAAFQLLPPPVPAGSWRQHTVGLLFAGTFCARL